MTVKERMLEIIQEQPEDSSYDEILRELAFARMVERGSEVPSPGSREQQGGSGTDPEPGTVIPQGGAAPSP
jgi:hypothetical protein